MGKGWDHAVPSSEYWKESLRITKPGGYLLAMGGTRTFHRLACAIEDSGYEIRDCIMWVYGSGFPKSHNMFGMPGYGTALKPAYEPIIVAMKPLDGTFKQNAEKWGLGGINIDGCRVGTDDTRAPASKNALGLINDDGWKCKQIIVGSQCGRWPANIIFDEESGKLLDEQSGLSRSPCGIVKGASRSGGIMGKTTGYHYQQGHSDSGGASRFFYCAKASSRERNEGLEEMPLLEAGVKNDSGRGFSESEPMKSIQYKNNHPTVKPLALMHYLIKLISPPENALILDPFCGSGTTILAAKQLGIDAIGIEREEQYAQIARKRIESYKPPIAEPDLFDMVN